MKPTALVPLSLAVALLAACGPSIPELHFAEPGSLLDERVAWKGSKAGVVWLRNHVDVRVDVAATEADAVSSLTFHSARTRFGGSEPEIVTVLVPAGAVHGSTIARVVTPASTYEVQPTKVSESRRLPKVDPGQQVWSAQFAPQPEGSILEVLMQFTVKGALATDARWLAAPDGPTKELLVSYNLPTHAVGSLQVLGADVKPLVSEQEGRTILALRMEDVPAFQPLGPHLRYATRSASPRGFDRTYVDDWGDVAGPYEKELLQRSVELREFHAAPFKPKSFGDEAVETVYAWLRHRIQREDAMESDWDDGQKLPIALKTNSLTAIDKTHVLHWILDATVTMHRMAAVRTRSYPSLDPSFPTEGAFENALVYVPALDLWLDPACKKCEMGKIRPEFLGGQALLLPASGEKPRWLPKE